MIKNFVAVLLVGLFVLGVNGQSTQKPQKNENDKTAASVYDASSLAKAAFDAHGGEKLKKMKTLVMRGSADVTTSAITQAIPATFSIAIAGEKYFLELNNPFQPLKQVFDGQDTHSSIRGFTLPPVTSLGFPLLPRYGDAGYSVSALAEKKKRGFRMTSPEGFYTDFYLDEKTSQIKSYESSYEVNGRIVTTSVEIDKFRIVDGIVIPERYAQRFDLGQMTAYANFKTKEILINTEIADDVFALRD